MIAFCYTTLVVLLSILILLNVYRMRLFHHARRTGKLPQKGKVTMFDVRHMLMEGKKDLAIQLYCEIFGVTIPKAKKDVEELQRSLRV